MVIMKIFSFMINRDTEPKRVNLTEWIAQVIMEQDCEDILQIK